MKKIGETEKFVILGLALIILGLAGSASDKAKDQAKIYEGGLEAMRGQEYSPVTAKLVEWKFGVLESWDVENPTPKVISQYNRGKVKFSKQEFSDIFAPGGKFRVIVLSRLAEKEWATLGAVNDMGMSVNKDAEIQVERYCVIRVVFKENKLVHFRVWPKLEQSSFSGGTWRIR
jgi:hypothetical protein